MRSFVDEPPAAIEGRPEGAVVNLTDLRAGSARRAQVELMTARPDRIVGTLRRLRDAGELLRLAMPDRHRVHARRERRQRRLHGAIAAAAERAPKDFQDLLLVPGSARAPSSRWRWRPG